MSNEKAHSGGIFARFFKHGNNGGRRRASSVRLAVECLEARALMSASGPDFNHDGFDDLAVGVPGEDIGTVADAGAVNVIYGGGGISVLNPGGLKSAGNRVFSQDTPGVEGVAEKGDRFGSALAWGDFNHDGFDDLAVGVPGEDIGTVVNAGAVNVLFGSASGLT